MARQPSFSLFKKSDLEGYLDKINSGITSRLKSGKTRVWCELYTTTLYIFKEAKRSSTIPQQLDLKQVQTVRKSTSDKTGTHFEVLIKNKAQTFSASSADDCNNWIRHLQHAMTLKDQDTMQKPIDRSEITVGDYETIMILPEDNSAAPVFRIQDSTASESDYAEIGLENLGPPAQPQPLLRDLVNKAATVAESEDPRKATGEQQQEPKTDEDYGYAEIELRKSPGSGQAVVQEAHGTRESPTSPVLPGVSQPDVPEEEYVYARVEVRAKRDSSQRLPVPACPPETRIEAEGCEKDTSGYAKVKPRTKPASVSTLGDSDDSPRTAGDGVSDDSDDLSDENDVYMEASSQADPGPIPAFPYPLQPDDVEPLAALQEFLSNNRKVCRWSFFDRTVVEDPVGDMKRLLQELHLTS